MGLCPQRVRRPGKGDATHQTMAAPLQRGAQAETKLRLHQDHPGAGPANPSRCPDPPRRRHLLRSLSPTQGPWPSPSESSPMSWVSGTAPERFPSCSGTSWSFSKRDRPPVHPSPDRQLPRPLLRWVLLCRLCRARWRWPGDFWREGSKEPLRLLQEEMEGAAEGLEFEYAAILRDRLERLEIPSEGVGGLSGKGGGSLLRLPGPWLSGRRPTLPDPEGVGGRRRSPIPRGKAGRQRAARKIEGSSRLRRRRWATSPRRPLRRFSWWPGGSAFGSERWPGLQPEEWLTLASEAEPIREHPPSGS